jgi:hypothetical protein
MKETLRALDFDENDAVACGRQACLISNDGLAVGVLNTRALIADLFCFNSVVARSLLRSSTLRSHPQSSPTQGVPRIIFKTSSDVYSLPTFASM